MALGAHITGVKTAFHQYLLDRQKQLTGGKRPISGQEWKTIFEEYYGNKPIRNEVSVPADAQVMEETPYNLKVKMADGSIVNYARDTSGNTEGVTQNVEYRPPTQQETAKATIQDQVYQQILEQTKPGAAAAIPILDEETKKQLDAITASAQASNQQQYSTQSNDLLTRLFGSGLQGSSVAGDAAARMLQEQGLVNTQTTSDAASRELALRNTSADRRAELVQQLLQQFQTEDQFKQQLALEQSKFDEAKRTQTAAEQLSEAQFLEQRKQSRRQAALGLAGTVLGAGTSLLTGGLGGLFGGASKAATTGLSGLNTYGQGTYNPINYGSTFG